jgi:hypothetical protein
MKRRDPYSLLAAAAFVALGCGHRRLPPGTPPPEYEQPVVSPWPPPAAPASTEAAPATPEPAAEPPAPEPPPTDVGAPPDAGAPALLDGGSPEAG